MIIFSFSIFLYTECAHDGADLVGADLAVAVAVEQAERLLPLVLFGLREK